MFEGKKGKKIFTFQHLEAVDRLLKEDTGVRGTTESWLVEKLVLEGLLPKDEYVNKLFLDLYEGRYSLQGALSELFRIFCDEKHLHTPYNLNFVKFARRYAIGVYTNWHDAGRNHYFYDRLCKLRWCLEHFKLNAPLTTVLVNDWLDNRREDICLNDMYDAIIQEWDVLWNHQDVYGFLMVLVEKHLEYTSENQVIYDFRRLVLDMQDYWGITVRSIGTKYTYFYEFTGDIYPCEIKYLQNPSKHSYQFSVLIPIKYDTYEKAEACKAYLRFCKVDGHVVLAIFSDFEQGFNEKGEWFEKVAGNVIDVIQWHEWWRYTMSKSKGDFTDCCDSESFLPCAEQWDDIFQVDKLPDDWGRNVQGLAYSVHCKVVKQ